MHKPARTIVEKILESNRITEDGDRSLLYVDRLVVADTALPAFETLRSAGYTTRNPAQALVIPDHYTPSSGATLAHVADDERRNLIRNTARVAREQGITVFDLGDRRQGIQHVVSTEQGFAQPGLVLVAVDSHTSTQGAVGALAFSISADLPHVLATQCIWLKTPRMMRINLEGRLAAGVTPKDLVLGIIAQLGSRGAGGFAVEYAGRLVREFSIEARTTICNLAAEMGARLAIVAPDDKTIDYLHGRPYAPTERDWDAAIAYWRTLPSDPEARFERDLSFDASDFEPMVTWGNHTENAVPITGVVPDPAQEPDPERRAHMIKSLDYMGLKPATRMTDIEIQQVFIGSCANSRIEDLREAAKLLRGRKAVVPTLIVPGSGLVKAQAEAEGLDVIFRSAGATWGEAGCSMCNSMNGDTVPAGARCASTSNRNHMGRQGRGSRTHLLSPPMAAAAAITGRLTDVRTLAVA